MPGSSGFGASLRRAGSRWGSFILRVESTKSTNDLALDYARRGAPHGSVFLARQQTAGRGRFARRWESPPGGLFVSVVLRPERGRRVELLPHLVAVAAAETLHQTAGTDTCLRWPNDLYEHGQKLGGILCEGSFRGSEPEAFVAGIGINVDVASESFSPPVRHRAATLSVTGVSVETVAVSLIVTIERWWSRGADAPVLDRYRELACHLRGQRVRVEASDGDGFEAVTDDIADDGGLVVLLSDGERRVLHAETVTLVDDEEAIADENYYQTIETHFIDLRGSPLFMTPAEWFLVSQWEAEGIPLDVVKGAIDRVFERPTKSGRPRKLGFCRQAVRAAFRDFREIQLGTNRQASETEPDSSSHLRALSEALVDAYPDIARRLDELRASPQSPTALEETLEALDLEMIQAAEDGLDPHARAALENEASRSLESYRERMPEEVYRSAVTSAYRKRLRRSLELPLLSLWVR